MSVQVSCSSRLHMLMHATMRIVMQLTWRVIRDTRQEIRRTYDCHVLLQISTYISHMTSLAVLCASDVDPLTFHRPPFAYIGTLGIQLCCCLQQQKCCVWLRGRIFLRFLKKMKKDGILRKWTEAVRAKFPKVLEANRRHPDIFWGQRCGFRGKWPRLAICGLF